MFFYYVFGFVTSWLEDSDTVANAEQILMDNPSFGLISYLFT